MVLQKIEKKLDIQIYDVVDEKTAIQARSDVSNLRAEIRRIEAEKLRITLPLREKINEFNSEVKKITDSLQRVLNLLIKSGNDYIAKQKELKQKAEQIERERIAEQNKKTGDVLSDALAIANTIADRRAEIQLPEIKTRTIKKLVYDAPTLKKWLAKNADRYLSIDEQAVKRDLALLIGCPAEIKEVETL